MSSDNVTPTHKVTGHSYWSWGACCEDWGISSLKVSSVKLRGEDRGRLNNWKLPAPQGKELDSSNITLDLVFKPHLLAQCPDASVDCFRNGPGSLEMPLEGHAQLFIESYMRGSKPPD